MVIRQIDQGIGNLFRFGHRLRGKNNDGAIHTRVVKAGIDRGTIALGGCVTNDVHGISMGPDIRQDFVQFSNRVATEFRQLDIQIRGPVSGHDSRTAAIGDDRQPVPIGRDKREESALAAENSWVTVSTRNTPERERAAAKVSSLPTRAPV